MLFRYYKTRYVALKPGVNFEATLWGIRFDLAGVVEAPSAGAALATAATLGAVPPVVEAVEKPQLYKGSLQ